MAGGKKKIITINKTWPCRSRLHLARNMHGYMAADFVCSEKRTVFSKCSSTKTLSFEEQKMSKEKKIETYFRAK